jgi:hypothetical protein
LSRLERRLLSIGSQVVILLTPKGRFEDVFVVGSCAERPRAARA